MSLSLEQALSILDAARGGDRRMLARAITLVESGVPSVRAAMGNTPTRRSTRPGCPHVVGISGPPGAGKSSLVDRLISVARSRDQRVAVLAVDPSSPFSGGAILGDRVRMIQHSSDVGVFVRSLASRGHLGGLSMATGSVVDLLDTCGWDLVLVETVGVGQSEIAVMEVADTVVVVLTPESGDTVQTMKAGLLEIADLFVVNKADRPGAAHFAREMEMAVEMDSRPGWRAPVVQASALRQEGIETVLAQVDAHRDWFVGEGRQAWQERRARGRVGLCLDMVADRARQQARTRLQGQRRDLLERLERGELEPYQAFLSLEGLEGQG